MTHNGILDVRKTLLIEAMFLDSVVYEIERGMPDEVGGARVSREEGESCLPCGAFDAELVQVFDSLAAQLLARRRIGGDLDSIFYLQERSISRSLNKQANSRAYLVLHFLVFSKLIKQR
jgi:hypothetical protein